MKALVLFSGGSDSTLAAALMAEQFQEVHLYTGNRRGYYQAEQATSPAHLRLARVYGQEKFLRKVDWIEPIHAWINGPLRKALHREHASSVVALSFAKIALHLGAIRYAKANGIQRIVDGSMPYMFKYPDQNRRIGASLYQDLYRRQSLHLSHPVAKFGDSVEKLLFQRSVNSEPTHRGTESDSQVFYSEQFLFSLFLRFSITRFGYREHSNRMHRVYSEAISAAEKEFLK